MSREGTYVYASETGRVRGTLRIGTVHRVRARATDPIDGEPLWGTVEIFEIKLETDTGSWPEAFGDRRLADAFLRGCKAALAMNNQYEFPGTVDEFIWLGRRMDVAAIE